jgi:hypothetical protein
MLRPVGYRALAKGLLYTENFFGFMFPQRNFGSFKSPDIEPVLEKVFDHERLGRHD